MEKGHTAQKNEITGKFPHFVLICLERSLERGYGHITHRQIELAKTLHGILHPPVMEKYASGVH